MRGWHRSVVLLRILLRNERWKNTFKMRINKVETFLIDNRRVLLKISTDTGLSGWGEPTLESSVRPVVTVVEQMSEYLIGKDPRHITHHWQVLSRGGFYRGGPLFHSALAGIDQALWDIKGRSLGVPISELLGGATRTRLRMYAHASKVGRTGDLRRATELVSAGYSLIKVVPPGPTRFIETARYIEQFVEDLTELRNTIGNKVDFGVDLHGRFSVAMSKRVLSLVEHLKPAFFEEPLRPEYSAMIGEIVRATAVPIATGERLYSRTDFRQVFEAGVAIAQPDLSHAGGITECFRIASQAEIYDAQFAPHCPLGPVALAACLQVDAAISNFYIQESVIDLHDPTADQGLELLLNPDVLVLNDGYVSVLPGPGLGIEVNEDRVRSLVNSGLLKSGAETWFFTDDGSFTDW